MKIKIDGREPHVVPVRDEIEELCAEHIADYGPGHDEFIGYVDYETDESNPENRLGVVAIWDDSPAAVNYMDVGRICCRQCASSESLSGASTK